jgi:RNA recognition motif-containing protein
MNIYVSNLNSSISSEDLKQLFTPFGEVASAEVVNDVFTGESRGFGYVEMNDATAAEKAISSLHNTVVSELNIAVTEAKPVKVQQGSYKVGNSPAGDVFKFRKN